MSTTGATFDSAMRRVLRVPPGPPAATDDQAYRLFSASIALSAARCLVTYVILPVLAPIAGPVSGNRPAVGIPLSVIAIVFNVLAVRRFWLADHRWRRKMTALYCVITLMITGLLAYDISLAI